MARTGTYGTVQPARLDASDGDLEVEYLIPIETSELASAAHNLSAES